MKADSRVPHYDSTGLYIPIWEREGIAKGMTDGTTKSLLAILDVRGVEVPDDVRARITECDDIDQLEAWLRRAATAEKIQDVIA